MAPGGGHGPGGHRGADPDAKPRNAKAAWKRLLSELRLFRWMILAQFILIALSTTVGVVVPAILGKATDAILSANMNLLVRLLLLALGLSILAALFQYVSGSINRVMVQSLGYRLRKRASQKINRLPMSYLESHDTGDLVSRTTNNVDNIVQALHQVIGRALESVISLVGVLAMMIWISPWLALIAVATLPIVGAGSALIIKKSQPHFKTQWAQTSEVSTLVEQAFSGQQILSLHGAAPVYAAKFEGENNKLREAVFKSQAISMLMHPLMVVVNNLSYVVIAVVGALFVLNGTITIGGVQAFIQYSRTFANPLSTIMQIISTLQSTLASAEKVFEFLDAEESDIETDGTELPPDTDMGKLVTTAEEEKVADLVTKPVPQTLDLAQAEIRFEDVTFSYVLGKPVIKNLNLVVKPGQAVAIVGPTGAGKTTLVNLLERYVDPESGRITIGGTDLRELPIEELRAQIGMVAQDPWLVDDTIAGNIAFGDCQADQERLLIAARQANLDTLVHPLPDGYDTEIDNDSGMMSAGEKQLLTIARAFYAARPIMILDEATSAVDTRTELLLAKSLARLGKGRTTFTIAHRLSTIRGADVILVMEDGQLVESGTHEQLLASQGAYHRLYQSQFAGA